MSELDHNHGVYQERAISDPHRQLSKIPVEILAGFDPVLWYYQGHTDNPKSVVSENPQAGSLEIDGYMALFRFTLPEGKRLVIDNIINDFDMNKPLPRRQVQIYRNPEGFLIADRLIGGEIVKNSQEPLVEINADGKLTVDRNVVVTRAMDSDVHRSDKKQIETGRGDRLGLIQLMSTTARSFQYLEGDSGYYCSYEHEITVYTEDDTSSQIMVEISTSGFNLPEPLSFVLVDDNPEIAPRRYQ